LNFSASRCPHVLRNQSHSRGVSLKVYALTNAESRRIVSDRAIAVQKQRVSLQHIVASRSG
jgi:hypothetical protein